jgi:bifunctional DNase/RNase
MRLGSIVALAVVCTVQVGAGVGCKRHAHGAAAGPPPLTAVAPTGYVETHVLRVVTMHSGGNAVLLTDSGELVALPIFIGGTEATSIDLRERGEHYVRPLTHDLLSETIHELGGRAVQVQVDDLVSDVYRGTVVLERSDGSLLVMDARPSDCIALALGEKVPIYVRKKLLDDEGVSVPSLSGEAGPGGGARRNPTSL